MNEQIKQLYKRAGGRTSIHNLMSNPMQQREYHELWDDRIEKFAHLIIDECIKIGQKTSNEIFDMSKVPGDMFEYKSHGAEDVVDNIKEHFGV